MAKSINPDKYVKSLIARTEEYADKVRKHYVTATNALLALSSGLDLPEGEVFKFADHPKVSAKATEIMRGLYSSVYNEIKGGIKSEWDLANISNDELIASIFGKDVMEDNHFAKWFSRNQEALDSFFTRKSADGGLNLSQRVWKYTGQLKGEMELALSVSMGQGKSASSVSKEVRKYLNEPNKLFRRVKDNNGNLKLSKAAKAYSPGQGVYRSSYKNAMRVTRTETNMAYREADWTRWQEMDFVVGFEVHRGHRTPVFPCSICESLAGKYPKEFKFKGWHPQCFCYCTPILATEDEMIEMQERILADEPVSSTSSVNLVEDMPKDFDDWIDANKERINNASSTPYWIRDNFVGGNVTKGLKLTDEIKVKKANILKQEAVSVANTVIESATEFKAVDTSGLLEAIKTGDTVQIKAKTKELKLEVSNARKAAVEEYKEYPTEWGLTNEFGKDSSDAFMKAWTKYTSQKSSLNDIEYLKVIEKEIFYGKKNVGKYATSEKMIYFLEKEKERVLATIEQKQIIESVEDAIKLSKITKSAPMKKLAQEFDDLTSSNANNAILKAKAQELNNYYIKLEQDRIRRLAKKASKNGVDDVSFFDTKHITNESVNWTKEEKDKIDVLRFKWKEALIKHNNDYRQNSVLDAQNALAKELRELSMKYAEKRAPLKHIDGVSDAQIKEALKRYLDSSKVGGSYYSKGIGGEFVGSYSDLYKELAKELNAKGIEITKKEISLIGRYTDGSGFINGYLSGKDKNLSWSSLLDDYRTATNGALEKMPRYNGVTFRGMDSYAAETLKEMQNCLATGKVYTEKCIMSTSTNIRRSDSFDGFVMLKIYGRTGADCKMISSYGFEDEVIFRSGSKFKVLSVEKQTDSIGVGNRSGIWVVELEDIND